jgi:hypothetical protein
MYICMYDMYKMYNMCNMRSLGKNDKCQSKVPYLEFKFWLDGTALRIRLPGTVHVQDQEEYRQL